jgi:hypothetical protein
MRPGHLRHPELRLAGGRALAPRGPLMTQRRHLWLIGLQGGVRRLSALELSASSCVPAESGVSELEFR